MTILSDRYCVTLLQLIRGMYSVFLSRWLRAVPRERILAVTSEHFMDNEISTMHQVRTPRI